MQVLKAEATGSGSGDTGPGSVATCPGSGATGPDSVATGPGSGATGPGSIKTDGGGMLGLDIFELESAWLLEEEEETVSSILIAPSS